MLPAEILYSSNWQEPQHRVYQHYSEEDVLITDSATQLSLNLITNQSYQRLVREGRRHIHLGIVMVRISLNHRKFAGIKVYSCFFTQVSEVIIYEFDSWQYPNCTYKEEPQQHFFIEEEPREGPMVKQLQTQIRAMTEQVADLMQQIHELKEDMQT